MAVTPARSTLISNGCNTGQIHPYFLWLLPLPDPPLFLMAVTLRYTTTSARSTLIFLWLLPLPDPPLLLKTVTPARSTLIPQGCVPCQIHPYSLKVASTGQIYFSSQRLLVLPYPSLFLKAFSCQTHFYPSRLLPLPDLPLFLKAAATARSTLIL